MFYNRVNSSDQYESIRGMDYEEEIQLSNEEESGVHYTAWNKFMNTIIYTPTEKAANYLSQYYIFNKLIDYSFDVKYYLDEKFHKRPYLRPVLIFMLISLALIFFSILGYHNYINYINNLALYLDPEFEFNANLTILSQQEIDRKDSQTPSEMLNIMLLKYNHDFNDLPISEQYRLNLLHQIRDASQIENNSLGWVSKFLRGSKDKVQDVRWEALDRLRRNQIRKSFLHAWKGYKNLAMGHDEIKPLRKSYSDKSLGWGLTLFDNLDTLIIMGLQPEFEEAKKHAMQVDFSKLSGTMNFQELISSGLGGLLGAHELTSDDDLLTKAEELAQIAISAFNTPHGLPAPNFELNSQKQNEKITTIGKLSSFQLEFIRLGALTENQTYTEKANLVRNLLGVTILNNPGIYPTQFNIELATASGKATLDADGGRFYEVLLKEYILKNMKQDELKNQYLKSLNAIQRKMIIAHPNLGMAFIGGLSETSKPLYDMPHSSCFLPGTIALGSKILKRSKDMELAHNITKTCFEMYKITPTSLAPEMIYFLGLDPNDYYSRVTSFTNATFFEENHFSIYDANFLLSSETVETLFYMYRITKDRIYQQMGWEIFMAIEKMCKVKHGYSTYKNILKLRTSNNAAKILLGDMPSTFLSKTMKYLYLLFSPTEPVPERNVVNENPEALSLDFFLDLDKFILTTGAHPLKTFDDK